jgi:hypothetical protein
MMARDVLDLVEPYLSEDPTKWGRLSSDIQWRRMQLLLLREILVELRALNRGDAERPPPPADGEPE